MDTISESLSDAASAWLSGFERALTESDCDTLAEFFLPDSHWRDLLALTWDITTFSGAAAIAAALCASGGRDGATGFRVDEADAPARIVFRGGKEDVVEAIFRFTAPSGPCEGVLRLLRDATDDGKLKAWTILTALIEIAGHEETVGAARPTGEVYSRDFAGPNWLDRRQISAAYENREPDVLVVGGGQAGLSTAARLTQLGVDTLIVDREERVGDNWRKRYHSLVLHNQVHVNHLPYLPFPPNWPTYIPKDKLANWFEAYADIMELNFWTETEFTGATYDQTEQRWAAELTKPDGSKCQIRPRHIVMATSVSGIPKMPAIPTLENFDGEVMHSGKYTSAAGRQGSNVLIIGTGTSGHDVAQDLQSNGAHPTLVQRSPTSVINVEPSAQLPYTLYAEDLTLETKDLIAAATPLQPLKEAHRLMAEESTRLDTDLLEGLTANGFKIDRDDVYGWQFKFMNRGGGYYFNVGCSDLIVDGKVGLIQYDDIETFVAEGAKLRDGTVIPADTVILATGYKTQEEMVKKLLGKDIADRVGAIWGWDEDAQELNNMWTRTGQPGLWFIAGSFAQCRIYSKYLGLQIKACLEGLISPKRR